MSYAFTDFQQIDELESCQWDEFNEEWDQQWEMFQDAENTFSAED